MAVRVLPHSRARFADRAVSLPLALVALALAAPALDLLKLVQPQLGPSLAVPGIAACALATCGLLAVWLRSPRTNWLAAAAFASAAGVALRLLGADVSPLLSLLAIVAVGVGGGFANPDVTLAGV